jgi:heat shock protein HslJ
MKEIEVTVDTDGSVQIEAIGFTGKLCEKATAEIERELGQVTARKHKPEYHQAVSTAARQKLRG